MEQTAPFYTPDGKFNVGGPMSRPKGAVDASIVFPDIKNGKYPPQIDQNKYKESISKQVSVTNTQNLFKLMALDHAKKVVIVGNYNTDLHDSEQLKDIVFFHNEILELVCKQAPLQCKFLNFSKDIGKNDLEVDRIHLNSEIGRAHV